MKELLCLLFIDTLIYGIFFPSDGQCDSPNTKQSCLEPQSQIFRGQSLCSWDREENICRLKPPPNSIYFLLLIAFIIIVLAKPLDILLRYLLEKYLSLRPDFEKWGIDTNSWIGSVHHKSVMDVSPLAIALRIGEKAERVRQTGRYDDDDDYDDKDKYTLKKQVVDEEMGYVQKGVDWNAEFDNRHENPVIASNVFVEYLTPEEELSQVLQKAKYSIQDRYHRNSYQLFTKMVDGKDDNMATVRAMEQRLHIHPNGSRMPLTLYQRFFYSDADTMLIQKISNTRNKAEKIVERVLETEVHDESLLSVALIREFLIEQVSMYNRFSLRLTFNEIDGMTGRKIHPGLWVLGWTFFILTCCFFIYWVYAWGIKNAGSTLSSWGRDFG